MGMSIRGNRTLSVEVLLDKDGGIGLGECGEFNRFVSSWLEAEDFFGQAFSVEVCSPGLDRPLKETADFFWAKGREVKIVLHNPLDGKSGFVGRLTEIDEEKIILVVDEESVEIERALISRARLWLDTNVKKKKEKKVTKKSRKKKK